MGLRDRLAALLGASTYEAPLAPQPSLEDAGVEAVRKALGGQLSPMPQTQLRWYLADLESAMYAADAGDLGQAAQLCRALRRDGILAGVLSTRADGIVGLPKRFSGEDEMVRVLEGRDGDRSVFDAMLPPRELGLLAADGLLLGVGVGELIPVEGRDYPVLCRLDPAWLKYRWSENRWYYRSIAGFLPITPGDGRWVLHVAGGRVAPWQNGLWYALGQAWIHKSHAALHKANWEAKLANPARAAVAPAGATEQQRIGFLSRLIAWGINTVFELPIGWDVKLIESNGRGFESFEETIARSEREIIIAIAGQVVTTTGGTGFANADVHKSIRADLIKATADDVSHTINTQAIPPFVLDRWGEDALERAPSFEWDTKPPKDLKSEAEATTAMGAAIEQVNAGLAPYGLQVDAAELANRYGVPIVEVAEDKVAGAGQIYQYHYQYGILTVNEARASIGLDPIEGGDAPPRPLDATSDPDNVVDLDAARTGRGAA